ncbi:hypothetical protein [Sandarakinorhabdus rubra]|uniref:hypothetical protein n=1 Tax=Sandarakinorhabdus rubra TaxID=2672568 RepID=UPI0013DAF818|nr:hypothetical protein [Sandarakinorhabdus rubra]
MRLMSSLLLSLAAALPLSAQEAAPAAAPAAKPEVRTCLPVASIKGSNVVDRSTIDFTLRDGSVWRSRLRQPCPQLGSERAFSYQTSIPQLCAQDIITVIVPISGRMSGASCGLAPFEKLPPKVKARG